MTTEKRPRTRKELNITDAIEKIRFTEASYRRKCAEEVVKILDRVHPSARVLVATEARKLVESDPDLTIFETSDGPLAIRKNAPPIDTEGEPDPIPTGVREPLTPERRKIAGMA